MDLLDVLAAETKQSNESTPTPTANGNTWHMSQR